MNPGKAKRETVSDAHTGNGQRHGRIDGDVEQWFGRLGKHGRRRKARRPVEAN